MKRHFKENIGLYIAAILSVSYISCFFYLKTDLVTKLSELDLNNLGDFLAGAFSPLAFLWLVFGYLMQGRELKLQAVELKNAVEQYKDIAETSKEQHNHELQVYYEQQLKLFESNKAFIDLIHAPSRTASLFEGCHNYKFRLVNSGPQLTGVTGYKVNKEGKQEHISEKEFFLAGDAVSFNHDLNMENDRIAVNFFGRDANRNHFKIIINVSITDGNIMVINQEVETVVEVTPPPAKPSFLS